MPVLTNFKTTKITDADRKGPLAEVINRNGITNLTSINEDLLGKFNIKNKYATVVVSILGSQRSGKSAFLNCIISYAKSEDITAFKSMSSKASKDQCVTHGMNYYVITDDTSKINYLFIDVQGLGGDRSEADPTIMMFAYYISDVIIVNHRGRFETATLNILTPIATLVSKLKTKPVKPLLLFRIFDVDDEYDSDQAETNYKAVMKPRDDQYSGVRQSLNELFIVTKPPILFTRQPPLSARKNFDAGVFSDALNSDDDSLNFEHVVTSIMNIANSINGSPDVTSYIKTIAKNINAHSADINVSVFDTSSQVTKDDIGIWIYGSTFLKQGQTAIPSSVNPELKKPIDIVHGTEAEWLELIVPRQQLVQQTITAYNNRFGSAPKDIRDQGFEKLKSIIEPELDAADEKSSTLARAICLAATASTFANLYSTIFSDLDDNSKPLATYKTLIVNALNNCKATKLVIESTRAHFTNMFDSLTVQFGKLEKARATKISTESNQTAVSFTTYNYRDNLSPLLPNITKSYEECSNRLSTAFIAKNEIKPDSPITKLFNWLTGSASKLHKTLTPNLYKIHCSSDKVLEIANYTDAEALKQKSKTIDSYSSKNWDTIKTAKDKFINSFENHKEWFEKTRAKNLQQYIDEQSPIELRIRNEFYKLLVAAGNDVSMIPSKAGVIEKNPAYIYLTKFLKLDVHKIYTKENFIGAIPEMIQKHLTAITKYESAGQTLGILDFMEERMYIAWYDFLVQF